MWVCNIGRTGSLSGSSVGIAVGPPWFSFSLGGIVENAEGVLFSETGGEFRERIDQSNEMTTMRRNATPAIIIIGPLLSFVAPAEYIGFTGLFTG